MRIGQVAALAGVSTRTVRHYHHMGVLPEPERDSNGYRRYSIQDAMLLARVRRLTAIGMSLDEVADALAGDRSTDLEEILGELDRDLARQEQDIRDARERLAQLRRRVGTTDDPLATPVLARFVEQSAAAGIDGPSAQLDAQLMSLIPEEEASHLLAGLLPDPQDREAAEALRELYEQMDDIAHAHPDDPRIRDLAARVVAMVPAQMRAQIAQALACDDCGPVANAMSSQLAPGQAAVFEDVMRRLSRL